MYPYPPPQHPSPLFDKTWSADRPVEKLRRRNRHAYVVPLPQDLVRLGLLSTDSRDTWDSPHVFNESPSTSFPLSLPVSSAQTLFEFQRENGGDSWDVVSSVDPESEAEAWEFIGDDITV